MNNRPSYLSYDGRAHSRAFGRFLIVALLIIGFLAGFYFFLQTFLTPASVNQIEAGVEPNPSVIDTSACPPDKYLDCLGDKASNPECSESYVNWAEANCLGFVGAAYRR